jgi:Pyruvate kinase, barrel domain
VASDGIILSRGNLGLDVLPEKIAMLQKAVTSRCNVLGKPIIITRLVDTMAETPRPTRCRPVAGTLDLDRAPHPAAAWRPVAAAAAARRGGAVSTVAPLAKAHIPSTPFKAKDPHSGIRGGGTSAHIKMRRSPCGGRRR